MENVNSLQEGLIGRLAGGWVSVSGWIIVWYSKGLAVYTHSFFYLAGIVIHVMIQSEKLSTFLGFFGVFIGVLVRHLKCDHEIYL